MPLEVMSYSPPRVREISPQWTSPERMTVRLGSTSDASLACSWGKLAHVSYPYSSTAYWVDDAMITRSAPAASVASSHRHCASPSMVPVAAGQYQPWARAHTVRGPRNVRRSSMMTMTDTAPSVKV